MKGTIGRKDIGTLEMGLVLRNTARKKKYWEESLSIHLCSYSGTGSVYIYIYKQRSLKGKTSFHVISLKFQNLIIKQIN